MVPKSKYDLQAETTGWYKAAGCQRCSLAAEGLGDSPWALMLRHFVTLAPAYECRRTDPDHVFDDIDDWRGVCQWSLGAVTV